MSELIIKGQKAKEASYVLMNATTTEKNNALLKMAEILLKSSKEILEANKKDLENAKIYVDLFPCNECAKEIIQSGIKEVYYLEDKYANTNGVIASKRLFDACGVKYKCLKKEKDV